MVLIAFQNVLSNSFPGLAAIVVIMMILGECVALHHLRLGSFIMYVSGTFGLVVCILVFCPDLVLNCSIP
jgi:hypothetical protein